MCQIWVFTISLDSLIPKWPKASKSDEKWKSFISTHILVLMKSENQRCLCSKFSRPILTFLVILELVDRRDRRYPYLLVNYSLACYPSVKCPSEFGIDKISGSQNFYRSKVRIFHLFKKILFQISANSELTC